MIPGLRVIRGETKACVKEAQRVSELVGEEIGSSARTSRHELDLCRSVLSRADVRKTTRSDFFDCVVELERDRERPRRRGVPDLACVFTPCDLSVYSRKGVYDLVKKPCCGIVLDEKVRDGSPDVTRSMPKSCRILELVVNQLLPKLVIEPWINRSDIELLLGSRWRRRRWSSVAGLRTCSSGEESQELSSPKCALPTTVFVYHAIISLLRS